jgi:hypothetical protein
MRLEVRSVDHQLIRFSAPGCKTCKYPVKHAHMAPANKAVVDRLVWSILCWSIAPAQAITDYQHYPR